MRRLRSLVSMVVLFALFLQACGDEATNNQALTGAADASGMDAGGLGDLASDTDLSAAPVPIYVDSVVPALGPPAGGTYAITGGDVAMRAMKPSPSLTGCSLRMPGP